MADTLRIGNDTDNIVQCILDTVRAAQLLTRHSMFVIDFNERALLWRSERMMFLGERSEADASCLNPYWSHTTDEVRHRLMNMSGQLCVVVGEHFTKGRDGLVCIMDYPISVDGHEVYVRQKTIIMLIPDSRVKEAVFGGLRIISLNTVRESTADRMGCLLVMPDGDVYRYDMEAGAFDNTPLRIELTDREKDILLRSRTGSSYDELAQSMFISRNTVKRHLSNIFKKTDTHTIMQAINACEDLNLI